MNKYNMAIRNMRFDGDDILRKNSRIVEKFDEKLFQLIDDMNDTMKKFDGVGLAAPQLGVLKRVVVIDIGNGLIELVNPEIIKKEKSQVGYEGCLSCPDIMGLIERPYKIKVVAYDRNKEKIEINAEGLLARAICHEIDHLNGILFKDIAQKVINKSDLEKNK